VITFSVGGFNEKTHQMLGRYHGLAALPHSVAWCKKWLVCLASIPMHLVFMSYSGKVSWSWATPWRTLEGGGSRERSQNGAEISGGGNVCQTFTSTFPCILWICGQK